jgi:hypothetical protein
MSQPVEILLTAPETGCGCGGHDEPGPFELVEMETDGGDVQAEMVGERGDAQRSGRGVQEREGVAPQGRGEHGVTTVVAAPHCGVVDGEGPLGVPTRDHVLTVHELRVSGSSILIP